MATNVIIPVYNTEIGLFERALHSLAAQTTNRFIVTVVDDCSTPENTAKYKEACDKMRFVVKFIQSEQNCGPGVARQKGMDAAADGVDYFIFLDADDILFPHAVEYLSAEARLNKADVVVSDILVEGAHRIESGLIPVAGNNTWLHGKIYNKRFLIQNDIRFLDKKGLMNEDSYFNGLVANLAKRRFFLNHPLYFWSHNKNSITRTEDYSFSVKYNYDFFYSQFCLIRFFLNREEDINFGNAIANLYNTYQYETKVNKQDVEKMSDNLLYLSCSSKFLKKLSEKEVREYIYETVKQKMNDVEFDQSFLSWQNKFFY